VTKSVTLAELFVFACNPDHHGVNTIQPRVTLSAFFVSRLSLQGLPPSHRLPRVSVPNPSLPGCGRNRPIGSTAGPKSLDLLRDDREKLTTRSPTRPARDAPRSRDFWAVHRRILDEILIETMSSEVAGSYLICSTDHTFQATAHRLKPAVLCRVETMHGFPAALLPFLASVYYSSVSAVVPPLLHLETSLPAPARMNRDNTRCLSPVPAFGLLPRLVRLRVANTLVGSESATDAELPTAWPSLKLG
jgi:hypothetical protein